MCIERKNKQAVQGLLYVRFICFGNGNLVAAHDDSDGFWRRQILITVKDRDPARVDNPFLIEELSEERPGILLWMLEGLHRLLANRYQFTISERSIQNLEAAMADSDNLTQFMQATAYVRFKPDTEERSTYLYRAYTKWCEDNLESPVPQKKFSQFLLKNAGKYGLTFSKHIEGKYLGLPGRMRPPRLCCGIKHTKSEKLPPYAPQIIFSGYINGIGDAVISGGRYDDLLSEFDAPMGAAGFAIDTDAITMKHLSDDDVNYSDNPDVLVFAENGHEMKALRYVDELNEKGINAQFSVLETLEETEQFAKSRGIAEVESI